MTLRAFLSWLALWILAMLALCAFAGACVAIVSIIAERSQ